MTSTEIEQRLRSLELRQKGLSEIQEIQEQVVKQLSRRVAWATDIAIDTLSDEQLAALFRQKTLALLDDVDSPYEYVANSARCELEKAGLALPDHLPADL